MRDNTEYNRFKFYGSYGWQKIREQIRERDNNECQDCKKKGKVTIDQLEVHHIKELEYFPELAIEPSNLITLCTSCHNKRHDRFQVSENKLEDKFKEVW